jgi:hypothetical protein
MEYARSLKLVEQVLQAKSSEPEDLVVAYRLQGLCLSAMGKRKEALAAFRKLLSLKPDAEVSQAISPKLTDVFYRAVALCRKEKPITLWHDPPRVSVGEPLGGVELKVTLEADPYDLVRRLRLRYLPRKGEDFSQEIAVRGPGTYSFHLPDSAKDKEIVYFFEAANRHGGVLVRAANKDRLFHLGGTLEEIEEPPGLKEFIARAGPAETVEGFTPTSSSAHATWGHVATWSGVGLLALGAVATWQAKVYGNKYNDSFGEDTAAGDRSRTWAGVMYTGYFVGAALVTTGVILWLLDPGDDTAPTGSMSVGPAPTAGGISITITGRW